MTFDRLREGVPLHPHDGSEISGAMPNVNRVGGVDVRSHATRHQPGGADELLPAWTDYTPALTATTTDPSLGTGGVAQGRFLHIPDVLVVVRFRIQFGAGASGGSGQYQVSVPVNISSAIPSATTMSIGQTVLFDWSVSGHKELAVCYRASATTVGMFVDDATVSHNNPFIFTDDDRLGGSITYEPA